ncbi:MAG: hypothetical protein LBK12_01590 [Odoribacteraceae bacterium]|jgi:hypothetical protein|nr:hypothetical protein [Odoribacteraceae bacterium]
MRKRLLFTVATLLVAAAAARAQRVEYAAEVDTSYLLVGDHARLTLKVKAEEGVTVTFPLLRDTVARDVEIISGPARDSTWDKKDRRALIRETYVLTSFDTGLHVIPALPIKIEREGYATILQTDPITLIVNTYEVNEQEGYADIVPPKSSPWVFAEMLPYVPWVLLGMAAWAGIVLLVLFFLRSRKSSFPGGRPPVPPYALAMRELDEIREEKPWQHGRMKEYYTRLTGVLRAYMEGELEVPALEQTSLEILRALERREEVPARDREELERLLETADLVKFAKAMPLPGEESLHLNAAYDFVNHVNERTRPPEADAGETGAPGSVNH